MSISDAPQRPVLSQAMRDILQEAIDDAINPDPLARSARRIARSIQSSRRTHGPHLLTGTEKDVARADDVAAHVSDVAARTGDVIA